MYAARPSFSGGVTYLSRSGSKAEGGTDLADEVAALLPAVAETVEPKIQHRPCACPGPTRAFTLEA